VLYLYEITFNQRLSGLKILYFKMRNVSYRHRYPTMHKLKSMAIRLVLTCFILSLYSCRNYDSEKYISYENGAIQDLIPQMIKLDAILQSKYYEFDSITLLVNSTLDTAISEIYEPFGFEVAINGVPLEEDVIREREKTYFEELDQSEKEKKLFSALINGSIKERNLKYSFNIPQLKVKLTEGRNFEFENNEIGFLYISRIIFNRNFDKGYLSYSFYCGPSCAWENNIEIVKTNGYWKITQYFSGGMA
jgi:hypothetical protein